MSNDIIKVFIGFDKVESAAWHTFAHSILRQSSKPVALIPLNLQNLKDVYTRPRDQKQSNEFSFTRFLVPYLSGYEGYALFFDCDMLLRDDIAKIFEAVEKDPGKAVYVVQHNYTPKDDTKYLGTKQYDYPRKNWSSVVLWNCAHPSNKKVTPEFVNTASPMELHRFLWLQDNEIGKLDVRWNWLVGEYTNPPEDVKNVHWTVGGPYFLEYQDTAFGLEWFKEHARMQFVAQKLT